MFKHGSTGLGTGQALIDMLDGCQHRGPDSTGFALYEDVEPGKLRLRFLVEKENGASEGVGHNSGVEAAIEDIRTTLEDHGAEIVDAEHVGNSYRVVVRFSGDVQKLTYDMEHAATLISIGESLDIRKDVGGAHDVDDVFRVREVQGTHGLGHVRLATESEVKPEAAHPFWATGFTDIAIVHNGQITNYWLMRREMERRGHRFMSDCDSELLAVYTAHNLANGVALEDSLERSVSEIDGVFTYLVATRDQLGMAKDTMAAKPLVLYESDDLIALASEEVAIRAILPQEIDTYDPYDEETRVWQA
jgi:glutamine phosphoribosylpyrophosphate amidotransferase